MQHANVPPSHDVNQFARLNVSYLNEIRLKGQDVGVVERECLWCALPLNLPVLASAPAVSIDEEAEIGVVEKEFAVQSLDMDGFDVLLARDKVKRCVGLVEEGLSFCGLE